MAGDNLAHVRLLTLLNVKATHPRTEDEGSLGSAKRTRVVSVAPTAKASASPKKAQRDETDPPSHSLEEVVVAKEEDDDDEEAMATSSSEKDAFHWHFGAEAEALEGVDLAHVTYESARPLSILEGASMEQVVRTSTPAAQPVSRPHARIWQAFTSHYKKSPTILQKEVLPIVGAYMDLWHSRVTISEHTPLRQLLAMHAMSHVAKTRQRILKDNERLAKAAARAQKEQDEEDDEEELPELRDQGFTRPKVLLLAPFRHSAKVWMDALMAVSACEQVEQKARFSKEFSLPPGSIDKLSDPTTAHRYPEDHRHTFQGNIDDNFKLGVKLTRKTLKLYSPFYDSDILVASPLGLRLLMEKEHTWDYLSSVEVLLVDQMDVMLMQNWDHVKFVMERLNAIPKEAHNTDFSRVKPWYLDGHAPLLRQTILLSSFDAPEFRQLFHAQHNVGGRVRTSMLRPNDVPTMSSVAPGIRQTFYKFDSANAQGEADLRLQAFQQKILPLLQKSAVSSTHTMIVVPSYFDFVRLEDAFRRADPPVSYTTLSEYSSNKDISRAREAFFSGKKGFLLLTERFHFYRRYLIRGASTIVFYAPPDHAQYYPELINAPLTPRDGAAAAIEAADVQVLALYSKYDLLRLERIVGRAQARSMVTEGRPLWRFV